MSWTHWSSSFEFIDQVFGSYCKGCQRVYPMDLFGFWISRNIEALVRTRTTGVTGERVEKSGIGSRASVKAGAGPRDPLYPLQQYHRSGQSSRSYPYSVVAPDAPIDFVQLLTTYQVATGDFDENIRSVASLPPTGKR